MSGLMNALDDKKNVKLVLIDSEKQYKYVFVGLISHQKHVCSKNLPSILIPILDTLDHIKHGIVLSR